MKEEKKAKAPVKGIKTISGKRKWIILAAVVVLAAGGIFWFMGRSQNSTAMAAATGTLTAAAETSSITTTIVGSGNLAAVDAEDLKVPTGIKVQEVLVKSGDIVSAGDTLATLDEASLSAKLAAVQDEIDALDKDLNDLNSDTEKKTIAAYISGRVKKIYASEGDRVADVMQANGALLTLSVDGKMAVNFETTADISVGNSVDVSLSDGTFIDGTVSARSGGTCTVTMDDKKPAVGEAVSVYSKDGSSLGSGEVYINQPVYITGIAGTIDSINVSENDKISSGKKVITLTEAIASAEYKELLAERAELVETLQSLVTLAQTNTITATFSGTISSINIADGELTGSSSSSSSSQADSTSDNLANMSLSSETTSNTVINAATATNTANASKVNTGLADADQKVTLLSTTSTNKIDTQDALVSNISVLSQSPKEIADISGLTVTTPKTGEEPQKVIVETDQYTGTISWSPADSTFQAGTAYVAIVQLTAKATNQFSATTQYGNEIGNASVKLISPAVEAEGNTITLIISFAATEKAVTDTSAPAETPAQSTAQANTNMAAISSSSNINSNAASNYNSSAVSANSTASSSSTDSSTSSSSSSSSSTTAFSITSNENLVISISIDELDILSVELGQAVTITLDAINGEFTGEVTDISDTASASGGVVSYAAEVTIPKEESMKTGMSASATIIIDQKNNIITIPVGALQERGNRVFVYTQQDSETNALSGEVEVETGLSDGLKVEITSGLSEGDVVYYIMETSSSSSEETAMPSGSFGITSGSGEFSEGNMPSRGSMPEGGGFSGQ